MTQQVTALKLLAIGMADLHDMEFNQENPHQRVGDSFRLIFGLSSATCTRLWNDLVNEQKTKRPHFFLLTMLWLKSYRTELDLAISYQQDETTLRKYFWFYVEGVQSLKEKKILANWLNKQQSKKE